MPACSPRRARLTSAGRAPPARLVPGLAWRSAHAARRPARSPRPATLAALPSGPGVPCSARLARSRVSPCSARSAARCGPAPVRPAARGAPSLRFAPRVEGAAARPPPQFPPSGLLRPWHPPFKESPKGGTSSAPAWLGALASLPRFASARGASQQGTGPAWGLRPGAASLFSTPALPARPRGHSAWPPLRPLRGLPHKNTTPPFPPHPTSAPVLAVKGLDPSDSLRSPLTAPGRRATPLPHTRERGGWGTSPKAAPRPDAIPTPTTNRRRVPRG